MFQCNWNVPMDSEHTLFDNRKAGKPTPIIPNADYGRPECHGVGYYKFCSS